MNITIKQQAQALIKLESIRLEAVNNKRAALRLAYENAVKQDVIARLHTASLDNVYIYPEEPLQYHTVRVKSNAGIAEFKRYKRCRKPDTISEYTLALALQLLLRHKIISKKQLAKQVNIV